MVIDKVENMTFDTLRAMASPEMDSQIKILQQLAETPDAFRLRFFHLPADLRLYAKHALLNRWSQNNQVGTVESINIPAFTEKLIDGVQKGNWPCGMKPYENCDILVVDDLHLISNRDATQEEFYARILKPRIENRKLTVLFSECPYEALPKMIREDLRNILRLGIANIT